MSYQWKYETPKGFDTIYMRSDGENLTGLWFENSKDLSKHRLNGKMIILPIFQETCRWLDLYFSGREPDFTPQYKIEGLTPFRLEVINILNTIPYGKTMTYGEIAEKIAAARGIRRMSAQAVGQAVGWNPICIIVPCHRVLGAGGSLTGYGGGIDNKISLLKCEGIIS